MPDQKRPHKVFRVGGREFSIYLEYDEQLKESYPVYPDFVDQSEYTDEGRPFATAVQENCPYCKPQNPENPLPSDCGGCGWFHREQTPYDPIGVCMCDALRRENESNKEERE